MVYSSICKLTGNARLVWLQPKWTFQLQLGIGEGHGNPLQCSCLENPLGQKSLVGCSSWGCRKSDMTEWRTLGVGVFCTDLMTWKWASSPVFLLHSDSRRPSAGSFPSNVTPGWWGAAVYNRLVLCWGGANAELSPTAPGKWTLCPPTSFTTRTACQLPTASSLSANVVQAGTNLFADFKRKWDEMQKNPEEP